VTGHGLDGLGFDSRQVKEVFLYPTTLRPSVGPTQPSIQWVPRLKLPGREAVNSPESSAGLKLYLDAPSREIAIVRFVVQRQPSVSAECLTAILSEVCLHSLSVCVSAFFFILEMEAKYTFETYNCPSYEALRDVPDFLRSIGSGTGSM
jgi:hypothetical protein